MMCILFSRFLSIAVLLRAAQSFLQIPLFPIGYNYYADFAVNGGVIPVIIDTGNSQLFVVNSSSLIFDFPQTDGYISCLYLQEDTTNVNFQHPPNTYNGCGMNGGYTKLGNKSATYTYLNYSIASYIDIYNPHLHNWTAAKGDIGLGYGRCSLNVPCPTTPFQTILLHLTTSDNHTGSSDFDYYYNDQTAVMPFASPSSFSNSSTLIFGLDLQPSASATQSSMQLGYVKAAYESSIRWIQQPEQFPDYHEFLMFNPRICDIPLLGNYSTSCPVIIDTGSVCVTFPAEIYDSFAARLNFSANFSISIEELPPLSFFTDQSYTDEFYIPLESLLMPPSAFTVEQGAPYVRVGSDLQRLCLLRGGPLGEGYIITLGTLALHSLYFAADYSNNAVGLTTKLSPAEIESLSMRLSSGQAQCKEQVTCTGDSTYDPELNSCVNPPCNRYYFTRLDEETNQCVYNATAYGFGIAFVLAVSIMELLSYFTLQYSTYEMIQSSSSEATSYAFSRLDPLTISLGKLSTMIVDFIILHVFNWADDPRNPHAGNDGHVVQNNFHDEDNAINM